MTLRIFSMLCIALLLTAPRAVADDDTEARLGAALERAITEHERSLSALDARIAKLAKRAVKVERALVKARERGRESQLTSLSRRIRQLEDDMAKSAAQRDAARLALPSVDRAQDGLPAGVQIRVWEVGSLLDADIDVPALLRLRMPDVRAIVVRGRYAATASGAQDLLVRVNGELVKTGALAPLVVPEVRRLDRELVIAGSKDGEPLVIETGDATHAELILAYGRQSVEAAKRARADAIEAERAALEQARADAAGAAAADPRKESKLADVADAESRDALRLKRINEITTALADAHAERAAATTRQDALRARERMADAERQLADIRVRLDANVWEMTDAEGRLVLRGRVLDKSGQPLSFAWPAQPEATSETKQADALHALRDDVAALRGEVRELTGLIRELLQTRRR